MNVAAKVRSQVRASLSRFLGDRKVCRGREGWHDTAQGEAALAIGSQVVAASFYLAHHERNTKLDCTAWKSLALIVAKLAAGATSIIVTA